MLSLECSAPAQLKTTPITSKTLRHFHMPKTMLVDSCGNGKAIQCLLLLSKAAQFAQLRVPTVTAHKVNQDFVLKEPHPRMTLKEIGQ